MNPQSRCVEALWALDPNNSCETEVWADSWRGGGVTICVKVDGGNLKVHLSSRISPEVTEELLIMDLDGEGIDPQSLMLKPSFSSCGQYLYVALGNRTIQAKLESEGVVVDLLDEMGEVVDTNSIFYSDLNFEEDAA